MGKHSNTRRRNHGRPCPLSARRLGTVVLLLTIVPRCHSGSVNGVSTESTLEYSRLRNGANLQLDSWRHCICLTVCRGLWCVPISFLYCRSYLSNNFGPASHVNRSVGVPSIFNLAYCVGFRERRANAPPFGHRYRSLVPTNDMGQRNDQHDGTAYPSPRRGTDRVSHSVNSLHRGARTQD